MEPTDLIFDCPVCGQEIRRGFPFLKCDCSWGGTLEYNVHRAAVVYTPRSTVIVNPPDPTVAAQLRALCRPADAAPGHAAPASAGAGRARRRR